MHNTPHSEETKRKISIKKKLQWADAEYRLKSIESRKHLIISEEWRLKVSKGWFKKGQKPSNLEQLSRINTGNKYCLGKRFSEFKIDRSKGYSYPHKWLYRNFGSPMTCEKCGVLKKNNHEIHWANVDGIYEKDRSHFKRLCARCHKNNDLTPYRERKGALLLP